MFGVFALTQVSASHLDAGFSFPTELTRWTQSMEVLKEMRTNTLQLLAQHPTRLKKRANVFWKERWFGISADATCDCYSAPIVLRVCCRDCRKRSSSPRPKTKHFVLEAQYWISAQAVGSLCSKRWSMLSPQSSWPLVLMKDILQHPSRVIHHIDTSDLNAGYITNF